MAEVSVQVDISMSCEKAWEKLRNLTLAHHYVPGVVDTRLTTARAEGVGASRNVYQKRGGYLQETVTEWRDGEGFTLRLHKGEKDAPFRNAWFRYRINQVVPGVTRLTATMGYEPPFGPLGQVLDRLLLARIIKRVIGDVALGLKYFYEQGSTATRAELRAMKTQHTTAPHRL